MINIPVQSATSFYFNNICSTDFGIINCSMDTSGGSMPFSEPFLPSIDILETQIRNNYTPYYSGWMPKPLSFNLSFAFEDELNTATLRAVARWLMVDYYAEFYLDSDPTRIFYCRPQGDTPLNHSGNAGFISLTMRCNSCFSYSPVYVSETYDFSNNPNGSLIQFANEGDWLCEPQMQIQSIGSNNNISIFNQNNNNIEFAFIGLADQETIFIDNEKQFISTNLPHIYRFDNFNGNYLSLLYGVNNLFITGNCKIQFKYQFKTFS